MSDAARQRRSAGGLRLPRLSLRQREALEAWLFVSPILTGFLIFFVGPLILFNGATGLAKLALIRLFGLRILSSIRFPFHDHARKNLNWSNAQVLLRFLLVHLASLWFLVIILLKVR